MTTCWAGWWSCCLGGAGGIGGVSLLPPRAGCPLGGLIPTIYPQYPKAGSFLGGSFPLHPPRAGSILGGSPPPSTPQYPQTGFGSRTGH